MVRRFALVLAALLLVSCGIGHLHPTPTAATSGESRTVLLLGGSLMGQSQDLIESEMTRLGMAGTLQERAVGGSGLLSTYPTEETPGELLTRSLAETTPDIVVLGYSGNHPPPGNPLADGYERGSEEWHEDWNAELARMVEEAQAFGASVYVVKTPPVLVRSEEDHGDFPNARRNRVAKDAAAIAGDAGAGVVDWWEALGPKDCRVWIGVHGRGLKEIELCFAFDLWYPEDEQIRTVRSSDGIHLAPWGAARAARWTVSAIRPEWG